MSARDRRGFSVLPSAKARDRRGFSVLPSAKTRDRRGFSVLPSAKTPSFRSAPKRRKDAMASHEAEVVWAAARRETKGRRELIPNPLFNNLFCGSYSSPVTIDAISVGELHSQPLRQASRTSATSLNTRFAKRFCFRYNVFHSILDCKAAKELCFRGSQALYFYANQHRREPERSGFPIVQKHWRDVRSWMPCWRGRPQASFLRTRLRKDRHSRSGERTAGGCSCAPTAVTTFPPILPSSWNQAVRPALSGPTTSLS